MTKLTAQYLLALSASMIVTAGVCAAQIAPQYRAFERRSPQQMSAADASVLQAHSREVVRAAEFYGIDLERGSWTYQQSICPLMPKHLILNYTRRESTGAETQFAAVVPIVPRGNEPVRVVPVQRNGLAPFAAAETSQNSAAVFNRVWSSEGGDLKAIEAESNWITLGLCYAEMVGSHPLIVTATPLAERTAGPPTLRYVSDGGVAAIFNDVGIPSQTWSWTLAFDRHGVLISVEREKLAQNLRPSQLTATMNTPKPATAVEAVPAEARIPSPAPESVESPAIAPALAPTAAPLGNPPDEAAKNVTVTATNPAKARNPIILPDDQAPPGRIISGAQEAPTGRIISGPQELPPSSLK